MGSNKIEELPDIPVTRSSMPTLERYIAEITPLWESRWLTNAGPKHRKFQTQLEEYLGVPSLELFVNGHLALESALRASDLTGSVVTTPFTFASTPHAVVRAGLTPIFADIRPHDYTLDPKAVEAAIQPDTTAILPVHVYGVPCDVDAFQEIADRHGLKLIYDAAHAFGVQINGHPIASFGDASMFSFHATKLFHSVEGGAVASSDKELLRRLALERNFGMNDPEDIVLAGGNAKMTEFSAAMGICNLELVEAAISARRNVWETYTDAFAEEPGIQLLTLPSGIRANYAYFPLVFTEDFGATRDTVLKELKMRGITARKYFSPLATEYECYRTDHCETELPVAQYVSDRVLTLPLYSEMQPREVERVCEAVLESRNKG